MLAAVRLGGMQVQTVSDATPVVPKLRLGSFRLSPADWRENRFHWLLRVHIVIVASVLDGERLLLCVFFQGLVTLTEALTFSSNTCWSGVGAMIIAALDFTNSLNSFHTGWNLALL